MAKMTLLQMVTQAAAEIGQTPPTFLFGNTDTTAIQMLALAQREGRETAKRAGPWGGWPQLRKEYTNTYTPNVPPTVATGVIPLPGDIQYMINATIWDRAMKWQLLGPLTPQEWQVLKSGITVTGPRFRYRIMSSAGALTTSALALWLDPVPTSTVQLAFEYVTVNWAADLNGTPRPGWQADTDTFALDDDLMMLGLKWRFLRAKGLDYSQEFDEYEDQVGTELSRAGGARSLSLNARAPRGVHLIDTWQIPDQGYGT